MATKRLPIVEPYSSGYIQIFPDKVSAQADDMVFDSWADVPAASVIGPGMIRVAGVLYDCDGKSFTPTAIINKNSPLNFFNPENFLAIKSPSATTIPSTSAPTLTVTTNYYIDSLHPSASNSNPGTSPDLPWASIDKLVGMTLGSGVTVNIAGGGATYIYEETLAAYIPGTKFPYNNADNIVGSSTNPVVIKAYYPRGNVNIKPLISYYGSVASNEWTNETGIGPNVWSISYPGAGQYTFLSTACAYGPTDTLGVIRESGGTQTAAQMTTIGDYTFGTNKMYFYCVGNPTDVFGKVKVFGRAIFSSAWNGLRNVVIQGLMFNLCCIFKRENGQGAGSANAKLEICYNTLTKARIGDDSNKSTVIATESVIEVHDNVHYDSPFMALKLNTTISSVANTINWKMYRERMYGGNLCHSFGGALLYNQAVGSTNYAAYNNYGFDCRNGTGGRSIDGCMLYCDNGANTAAFVNNIAEQCAVAFQANNSKNVLISGNLAIDCYSIASITGANDVNLPAQSYIVAHNTLIWTGRIGSILQRGPQAASIDSPAIREWNDNFYTFGNKFSSFTCVNNLVIDNRVDSAKTILSYDSNATTTTVVGGFASAGLPLINTIVDNNRSIPSATYKNNLIAVAETYGNINSNFPQAHLGDPIFADKSVFIGTGAAVSVQYYGINGVAFNKYPTPGCYEPS